MPRNRPPLISRLTNRFSRESTYKKAVVEFAQKHNLIYFSSVHTSEDAAPVIRGSTSSIDHVDHHYSIGTHAGYDMTLVDRTSTISYNGYPSSTHRWYVIQIDLQHARKLPYIFIGTRQQSKAYYARILAGHRELRYLSLTSSSKRIAAFHSHFAVMASPAQTPVLYRLLNNETIESMAAHHYPFAIEIEDESVFIITRAIKPNQQLLDKLLHYGLWIAKEIDQKLG